MGKRRKQRIKNKAKFSSYLQSLSEENKSRLSTFFNELDNRLFLLGRDRKAIKKDFERAFTEYDILGIPFEKAIEYLDLSNLGGFYSRNSDFWLPLDEVGKSYTQFLDRNNMAVFREAFYLKERIHPEILQIALNFTIKRFPYFAMSIKKGFFWHYLDSIRRRFPIEKEGALPVRRIPISVSGSKAFRVLYYENRISVEFFHCMTDGTGAKEFLKSLTYTYLNLLGKDLKPSDLVIDHNSFVDEEEYRNEFLNVPRINNLSSYINKKALQLDGNLSSEKPCRVLHFRVNTDCLKAISQKYEVGISAYLATVAYFASKSAIDQREGEVSITIPVNMRKCLTSKTLRNFSLYTTLRRPICGFNDFKEVVTDWEKVLKTNINKDHMLEMAGAQASMMNQIRYMPLPMKIFGSKTLFRLFGDNIFTVALSNLGVCELPEDMSKEITGMDFVLGTSCINRAQLAVATVNNMTTISISKYTKDPSFEERIYSLLKEDGLDIVVEGSGVYGN